MSFAHKQTSMNGPAVIIPDYDSEHTPSSETPNAVQVPQHTIPNQRLHVNGSALIFDSMGERDRRCGNCGIQTHNFQTDPISHKSQKLPITIEKGFYQGRCSLCHPMPCQSEDYDFQQSMAIDSPISDLYATPHDATNPGQLSSIDISEDHEDSSEVLNIIHAMEKVALDEQSQEVGCEALWIHSWDDEASSIIGRFGGVNRIISAMINFPNNTHIQLCAFGALENLASNSWNRALIVGAGGALLVAQAMMRHDNNTSLSVYGFRALEALGYEGVSV